MATKPDADPQLTRRQAENARAAIKVGGLLSRLQRFAEAEVGDEDYGNVQMQPAQVKAAQVLLSKVLPDQTRVETEEITAPPSLAEIREEIVKMIAADPSLLEEASKLLDEPPKDDKVVPLVS